MQVRYEDVDNVQENTQQTDERIVENRATFPFPASTEVPTSYTNSAVLYGGPNDIRPMTETTRLITSAQGTFT